MLRTALRTIKFLALIVPLALPALSFAGGEYCRRMEVTKETAASCPMAKIVSKSVEVTADGAIVTLSGKTPAVVSHIQTHLRAHEKGGACPNCPLTLGGIEVSVTLTGDGGVITAKGRDEHSASVIQEWARIEGPPCCARGAHPART